MAMWAARVAALSGGAGGKLTSASLCSLVLRPLAPSIQLALRCMAQSWLPTLYVRLMAAQRP